MQYCVKYTSNWGRVLWITSGNAEVGVALDFGIRIVHLSCIGCDNLFYEQPADRSDTYVTESGWCLYGGHRLWLAPESDDSYHPDNAPVQYAINGNEILLEQELDPLLQVRKRVTLKFEETGHIRVVQEIENASSQVMHGAAWGVNTLDAGGEAKICFSCISTGGFNPTRVLSLWSDTNLNDPRLHFEKDCLQAKYMPLNDYLKVGLYSYPGKAVFRNKGQIFELTYEADAVELYPDNGCNFELYMCVQFMELESLGKKTTILPGQCATHTEVWRLVKCDC